MKPLVPRVTESTARGENAVADTVVAELLLAQATAHARLGEYAAAGELLDRLDQANVLKLRVLDLRARILAQQVRLDEAERLWQEFLRISPGAETARTALRQIEKYRGGRKGTPVKVVVGTVCILLLTGTLAILKHSYAPKAPTKTEAVSAAPVSGTKAASLGKSNDWAASLQAKGVRLNLKGPETVAEFESGLFLRGVTFRPGARGDLDALAKALSPVPDSTVIVVAGCSDNIPLRPRSVYKGAADLRLARAKAVAHYLTNRANLSRKIVSLQDSCWMSYPNDSPEERSKNRTAIVRIFTEDLASLSERQQSGR
jgi:tetratricopeptide (TPR) repeat protein